jgi:hypothetical protein
VRVLAGHGSVALPIETRKATLASLTTLLVGGRLVQFQHHAYDWNDTAPLARLLAGLAARGAIIAASSEGDAVVSEQVLLRQRANERTNLRKTADSELLVSGMPCLVNRVSSTTCKTAPPQFRAVQLSSGSGRISPLDPVQIRRARSMLFAYSKNLDQAALAPGKVI